MALRVTTQFTGLTGAPYLNVFNFPGSGSSDAAAAAVAASNFWQGIADKLSTALSWTRSGEVEEFDPANGQVSALHSTDPVNGVGTQAGERMPFAIQGLVRWRTGVFVDGREVRGRTFIPGLTQDMNDNGTLLPAVQSDIAADAGTLAALLGVWSRPIEPDPDADPPIAGRPGQIIPVSASSVWNQFAILRSRRD